MFRGKGKASRAEGETGKSAKIAISIHRQKGKETKNVFASELNSAEV